MALFEDRKLLLLLLRVCLVLLSLLTLSELSLLWYLSPSELNRSTVELLTNVCNVRFNARICRFFRFSFPFYLVTTLCLRSGWFGSIEIFSWFITPGSVATNETGTHPDVSLKTCSGFTSLTWCRLALLLFHHPNIKVVFRPLMLSDVCFVVDFVSRTTRTEK